MRGVKYIPEGRPMKLHEEHSLIIKAIKNRDPEAADKAAQNHIRNGYQIHLEASFHQRSS